MADNFPGPWQLRLYYTCSPGAWGGEQHVLQLNCDVDGTPSPGDAFADIDILRRVGIPTAATTVLTSLVTVLAPLFSADDTTFDYAELWKFTVGTFDAQYMSTQAVADVGTHVGAGDPAELSLWTFRSTEGGIMKVYLLETPDVGQAQQVYAGLTVPEQAFADYFTDGGTAYWLARDTSYPHIFLRHSPGEHEGVFKRRFRT